MERSIEKRSLAGALAQIAIECQSRPVLQPGDLGSLNFRQLEDSEARPLALYGEPEVVASRRVRHVDAQIDAHLLDK